MTFLYVHAQSTTLTVGLPFVFRDGHSPLTLICFPQINPYRLQAHVGLYTLVSE